MPGTSGPVAIAKDVPAISTDGGLWTVLTSDKQVGDLLEVLPKR